MLEDEQNKIENKIKIEIEMKDTAQKKTISSTLCIENIKVIHHSMNTVMKEDKKNSRMIKNMELLKYRLLIKIIIEIVFRSI